MKICQIMGLYVKLTPDFNLFRFWFKQVLLCKYLTHKQLHVVNINYGLSQETWLIKIFLPLYS
jgi:hypothetical protein